jgi:FkbM family methyltransferase
MKLLGMKAQLRQLARLMAGWPLIGRFVRIGVAVVRLPEFRAAYLDRNGSQERFETEQLPTLLQTISDLHHRQLAADNDRDNLVQSVPVALRKITRDLTDIPRQLENGVRAIEQRLGEMRGQLEGVANSTRTSHYLGDHRSLVVTARGDRMYLDTRDIMLTPGILCWGSWEPETTKSLERLLKPGMSWADIGANIGYFTVIGHKLVRDGGGTTFAFEANPATYELLADNVRLNWIFDGVTCEQKAIYSETATLKFGAPQKYAVNASIGEAANTEWNKVNDKLLTFDVEAVTIDDYFGVSRMDVMKIDVEGAESYVLRGGRRVIDANPHIKLLIEWSPGQMAKCKTSPQELIHVIQDYDFHVWSAEHERRKLGIDDLLNITNTTMVLLSRDKNFEW